MDSQQTWKLLEGEEGEKWRSTRRTLRGGECHGWKSSSNNLAQKLNKDWSFSILSPYLLISRMLGVGIYFYARLRGKLGVNVRLFF